MDHDIDDRLREPLDDEERELMDPDTWDWDSVEALPPVPSPGVVLPIRFSLDEMQRVSKAAEAQGITIFEYIKQSALTRVMHEIVN